MQRVDRLAFVLVITLVAAGSIGGPTAAAHVAPSVDDNNRYLKVTPAADRVRVAYTVFFGQVPGATLRRTLDTNRDGQISDGEGQVFGTKLALEVAAALEVSVDGKPVPLSWSTVAVGMGSPSVTAGAFSIDMVAWLCLPVARGRHTVLVTDRFRVPKPGETEVKVEDGLGITLEHVRIGTATSDPAHGFKFLGPGGPLADDGLDLAFLASDRAPLGDGACKLAARKSGIPWFAVLGAVGGVVAVVALAVALVLKLRRR